MTVTEVKRADEPSERRR